MTRGRASDGGTVSGVLGSLTGFGSDRSIASVAGFDLDGGGIVMITGGKRFVSDRTVLSSGFDSFGGSAAGFSLTVVSAVTGVVGRVSVLAVSAGFGRSFSLTAFVIGDGDGSGGGMNG